MISVRIRDGIKPNPDSGQGGATEGDIRGNSSDIISNSGGVVNKSGGHLLVHETAGTPDMNVVIDPGIGYIPNSSFSELDSDKVKFWEAISNDSEEIAIGSNSSGLDRIDIICLKIDTLITPNEFASNIATIVKVVGTAGAGIPATPNNHLKLAEITVADGATEIEDTDIEDTRSQIMLKTVVVPEQNIFTQDIEIPADGNILPDGNNPTRAFYIPASAMIPATTNGGAGAQMETSSNKINIPVIDFDQSTQEYAFFNIKAPSYWDLQTLKAVFDWTASGGSGDVIWGIQALARSNDDALDTALGTAEEVTDTLITADDLHTSPETDPITVGGTPIKDDFIFFRVYRKAADGADTLSADARLIGLKISFGISQFDDK